MAESALLATVEKAAIAQRRTQRLLVKQAAETARREAAQKEAARRQKIRRNLELHHRLRRRVRVAEQGLTSLLALGATKQFQSLIRLRNEPLIVCGGHYIQGPLRESPGSVMWVGRIMLLPECLRIESYIASAEGSSSEFKMDTETGFLQATFLYEVDAPLQRSLFLLRIATFHNPDWEMVHHDDPNFLYSREVLFARLVECADAKTLQHFVSGAIG